MILENQKFKFNIPDEISYLNMAYMSPLLKEVARIGKEAVDRKSAPFTIFPQDFFEPLTHLKTLFSCLIECDQPERICMIPSVSYGIATVINNINLNKGDEILVMEEQFPSNIYSWKRLAKRDEAELRIIKKPTTETDPGQAWNEAIIQAITDKTAVVSISHTHWADGTLFDLKTIRSKTRKHSALLIIDGTQSVGALPFSVAEFEPDALICAAYKWLLGPYASGLAYYGPYFDDGIPIEENWANRLDSENFSGLTKYQDQYKPFSNRYNVGEQANFIAVPMLTMAIQQILDWTPQGIQEYCKNITKDAIYSMKILGCKVEPANYRGHHLFGIKLPETISLEALKTEFQKQNIHVSIRGEYIRVSPYLYNSKHDMEKLTLAINTLI